MRKPLKRRMRQNHQIEFQTLKAHEDEFRGRNVIIIGREIYPIESGEQAARLLEELRKKYPGKSPLLTYVLGEETFWLFGTKDRTGSVGTRRLFGNVQSHFCGTRGPSD